MLFASNQLYKFATPTMIKVSGHPCNIISELDNTVKHISYIAVSTDWHTLSGPPGMCVVLAPKYIYFYFTKSAVEWFINKSTFLCPLVVYIQTYYVLSRFTPYIMALRVLGCLQLFHQSSTPQQQLTRWQVYYNVSVCVCTCINISEGHSPVFLFSDKYNIYRRKTGIIAQNRLKQIDLIYSMIIVRM